MTTEEKKQIEEFAELQFTREQIAILMQDDKIAARIVSGKDKEIETSLMRGWLKAEAEVRRSIKAQAIQGVSNAQKMMLELFDERKSAEQERLDA